ncbi:DUF1654 domain-containing protein [Pseudomonas viridiflava]|uniref:DUF1654 domain-containing protein n=1 Tax=Pseudomonas viridiflava TaxID=33069 RepID=UPI000F018C24|nr:DUF1654 domain-containing protein [Pseudomonas viridiflava]
MAQLAAKPAVRVEMSGVERLGLRVSGMINHPTAQIRRAVTIHRLDADGERDWEEVMGVLAETPELEITFNDDGSVTVAWENHEQASGVRQVVSKDPYKPD